MQRRLKWCHMNSFTSGMFCFLNALLLQLQHSFNVEDKTKISFLKSNHNRNSFTQIYWPCIYHNVEKFRSAPQTSLLHPSSCSILLLFIVAHEELEENETNIAGRPNNYLLWII